MTSPTGHCHTFDATADGYCRAEGCGALVLRRVSDAEMHSQPIHALVHGVAVKQDGTSASLTAPNGRAQEYLLQAALRDAQLTGADVDYIEAHGTGTALGDPIEMGALATVMGEDRDEDRPLVMGALKANIGHLEPAAGIAGLIKAILVLQHEQAPPNPALKSLNPKIAAVTQYLPVRFPTVLQELRELCGKVNDSDDNDDYDDTALVAGVSSFGYAGTIAHAVLGQAPSDLARTPGTVTSEAQQWAGLLQKRRSFPWRAMPHPMLQCRDMIDQDTTAYSAVFHESLMELMRDHTIGGRTILPGAGFVEMALAATVTQMGQLPDSPGIGGRKSDLGGVEEYVQLEGISFLEPLDLALESSSTGDIAKKDADVPFKGTELTCEMTLGGGMAFQGSSTNNKQNEDMQVYYCEVDAARCVRGGIDSDESSMNLSAVQERCSEIIEGLQDRYNVLHETFGMHGNQFQTLQQVWRSKGDISEEDTSSAPEELLARVSMPKDWNRYHIHPAALDGAFQLVGFLGNANDLEGSHATNGASSSWVPAGIDHVEMHRSIGRHDQHAELNSPLSNSSIASGMHLWAHARVVEATSTKRVLDFTIYHDDGVMTKPALVLRGFRFAVLPKQPPKAAIYETSWVEAPLSNACLLYTSPSPRDA